ncbi:DUF7115 domain-containing protein [Halonotius sp. GCM10025705]|uniref:DUF7115 domain-containing protein n=1 Tax=Halonotius sp. GCM10025705 TaxID=3252678 RepID=UPI003621C61A
MSLPDALTSALGEEPAVAEVSLGGDDILAVTPTRTLVYRAEGLLSDEAVEEYPHDAERLTLSEGRRKAKLTMEYGLDGTETLSMPSSRIDDALFPILAGVINAAGVTEPGESVLKTFRFSEITLIITSRQVVKHIGTPVWTEDFETFEYASITDVTFEEGSVATTVVLTHDGRQDRFKIPSDDARAVREAVVDAVCAFHEVDSIDALRAQVAAAADDEPDTPVDAEASADQLDFGEGIDPLGANPPDVDAEGNPDAATESTESESVGDEALAASLGQGGSDQSSTPAESEPATTADSGTTPTSGNPSSTTADSEAESQPTTTTTGTAADSTTTTDAATPETTQSSGFENSGFESAGPVDEDDLSETVATLAERIDRQEEQLARQNELIETLIEELRRGR